MIKKLDQKIIDSLRCRRNDAVSLTQFAVSCILYIDDLTLLASKTRLKLFEALAKNQQLLIQRNLINELSMEHGISYPEIEKQAYKDAYSKLMLSMPDMQYGDGLKEKIWSSLERTLLKSKFPGEWQMATLSEKLDHLHEEAFNFLEDLDKEKYIHSNDIFNDNFIDVETILVTEPMNSFLSFGCYSNYTDEIFISRYAIVLFSEDYIDQYNPEEVIDFEAVCRLYNVAVPETFSHEISRDIQHIQYNEDAENIRLITGMGTEINSKRAIAHELVHLVCSRLFLGFKVAPKKIEKEFGFNKKDASVYFTSKIGYIQGDEDEEAYYQNREEILAYEIENRFMAKFSQPVVS